MTPLYCSTETIIFSLLIKCEKKKKKSENFHSLVSTKYLFYLTYSPKLRLVSY